MHRRIAILGLMDGALLSIASLSAIAWRPLLQDDCARDWRGWKTPGLPAGWHAKGTHVEHWINGRRVVEYELNSADWRGRVEASKLAEYPNYGLATAGLIVDAVPDTGTGRP
jgi:hypothetical protein